VSLYKRDLDIDRRWSRLMSLLENHLGKRPKDLNAVLFLIGVQELGHGSRSFSKEEKQDLMHIAICRVLSPAGYYRLQGHDEDGWPHWKALRKLPRFDLPEQERLLRMQVLDYFEDEFGWVIAADHEDPNV
jgi:hypothetical protein